MKRNVIFCGTTSISVRCIEALIDKGIKPNLVITQPDKPSGRKKTIEFSDVKKFCIENNIKFIQPIKIIESIKEIKESNPDLLITCAYGQFIPDEILMIPKYFSINVHASLLPKYRGGAPIHWALINGEKETGITIIEMIKKMDAGDMFFSEKISIDKNETLDSLYKRMGDLAYKVLYEKIELFFDKNLKKNKQNENEVSFAFNIKREDEKIEFNIEDYKIHNKVRGLYPNPGAFFIFKNKVIKVYKIKLTKKTSNVEPGTIISISSEGLSVSTKTNDIILSEIKVEGKSIVKDSEILNYKNLFSIGEKIKD